MQILYSSVDTLQYMHQQEIYHLDIKPENLVSGPFESLYSKQCVV